MGTPEIAVSMLERLWSDSYRIIGVVSQPDKKVGRKQVLQMPPVKRAALAHDIPVYQPIRIRDDYEELMRPGYRFDCNLCIRAVHPFEAAGASDLWLSQCACIAAAKAERRSTDS